jgi:aspartyl protease family protein
MGFMTARLFRTIAPHSIGALGMCLCGAAAAVDVAVAGLFPAKAVLVVDGGAPRTVSVGARTPEGVRLVAVEGETAVVEAGGRQQTLRLGERAVSAPGASSASAVVLNANSLGHFVTEGSINGAGVTFLVDTGASAVAMGKADADRAGIDYRKGERMRTLTANGVVTTWRVKLDSVRVGDVTLRNVDGAVLAAGQPYVLLGMSFLNRMEMSRSGEQLTLRQRY